MLWRPRTRVANTPDFYNRQVKSSMEIMSPSAPDFDDVWLHNDSDTGLFAHVYGYQAALDPDGWVSFYWDRVNLGGSGNFTSQLAPDWANVDGFTDNNYTNFPATIKPYNQVRVPINGWMWPYSYPIAIIPPGYSWHTISQAANVRLTVNWWWVMMLPSLT